MYNYIKKISICKSGVSNLGHKAFVFYGKNHRGIEGACPQICFYFARMVLFQYTKRVCKRQLLLSCDFKVTLGTFSEMNRDSQLHD